MQWPPGFAADYSPKRTLALFDNYSIVEESGRVTRAGDWKELSEAVIERNLTLFVESYPAWMVDQSLAAGARVMYHRSRGIMGITWSKKRRRGWALPASCWNLPVERIFEIRQLLDYAGAGDQRTPGALGQALMARYVQRGEEDVTHFRPAKHAAETFWTHSVGGRVDTIRPGERFSELIEEDVNFAYLARCLLLPGGIARATSRREGIGFYKCSVHIPRWLKLGPFPHRARRVMPGGIEIDGVHNTTYPRRPGDYTCWLWSGEIDDAEVAGCGVEVERGFCWQRMTPALCDWALLMDAMRQAMRGIGLDGCIKTAAVAGLSRFGGRPETLRLSLEQTEDSTPLCDASGLTGVWIVPERSESCYQLPHWYSYIISEQRRSLYHRAAPRQEREELVATNYDSVYHVGEPAPSEDWLGGWKTRVLHDAVVIKARHLLSQEKTTRPGIPRDDPARYIIV